MVKKNEQNYDDAPNCVTQPNAMRLFVQQQFQTDNKENINTNYLPFAREMSQ